MGFFYAFVSIFLATTKDVVSKRLSFNVSSAVSTFGSFAFAIPGYLVLLLVLYLLGYEDFAMSGKFAFLVLLRSITDIGAEGFKMKSLELGDLSLVSCFFGLTPLFILISSPLITGDPITKAGVIAVIMVVIGTLILVIKPGKKNVKFDKKNLPAILMATASAVMFSLNSCLDRLAVFTASTTLSGFAMTLVSGLLIAPFVVFKKQNIQEMKVNFKTFLLRGLIETVFMVTKLTALRYMQAPYFVAIRQFSLIPTIISGRLIYKEKDFIRRLFAGLIILLGVLLVIYQIVMEGK